MRVSVVGTGNVGSSLLFSLAGNQSIDEVLVVSRRQESATAAIGDVASADPRGAEKFRIAGKEQLADSDIVVLASGARFSKGESRQEHLIKNSSISNEILSGSPLMPQSVVIVIASPVDDVTVNVHRESGLPAAQVIGFGGDLDLNRLEHVLHRHGVDGHDAKVVGEHGRNVIPVIPEAADYQLVAEKVRSFLAVISAAGPPRNIATGLMVGDLCNSIAVDSGRVHHVCGYHPDYGIHLTWPFRVGRQGIADAQPVDVQGAAARDLEALIAKRRSKV